MATTATTWYERIIAVHTAVTDAVSHGGRLKSSRYFVWQEEPGNDFNADGIHAERTHAGTTDLFSKREFEPWREEFEESLNAAPGIGWKLNYVGYEEDSGFWHWEWRWVVYG